MRARFERLLDLLIPQQCFVCGQSPASSLVCRVCAASMPCLSADACPTCALASPDGQKCAACLRKSPAFDGTQALYRYAFPVDRMVRALKYHNRLALAPYLGERLADQPLPGEVDLIVPMPLHPARLRERGFNQAVELSRPLARRRALTLAPSVVERRRNTVAQADLPLSERKANMRGAFDCPTRLDGLTIVVVDDVMTTGATLEALARTLKEHGAARVYNLVVARTPPPS